MSTAPPLAASATKRTALALLILAACKPSPDRPSPPEAAISAEPKIAPSAPAPSTPGQIAPSDPDRMMCFSWIEMHASSTDCYPTPEACEKARDDMKGPATAPCAWRTGASCTVLTASADRRCFGDQNNCERYRAFVKRNQHETSPCSAPRSPGP